MHELKEADREAILLRYFENRPFAEVGQRLGLNENAARMRVERAVEKLRGTLTKHGVTTVTALASVISAHAVQLAPVGLATTLTTVSIAGIGTGTFTLLKIMTMTKIKLGLSAVVVAGAATAFVIQHQTQTKLGAENQSLRQQMTQLQSDNASLSNRVAASSKSESWPKEQFNELLKLRGEVGLLRRQASELKSHPSVITEQANNSSLARNEVAYVGMAMLEAELREEKTQLANETMSLEHLAKDLNVPNELIQNVYAFTNITDGSLDAYQPYVRAVISRDVKAKLTLLLEDKIATERSLLQNK